VDRRRRPWWTGGDVRGGPEATSVVDRRRRPWWTGGDIRGRAEATFVVERRRRPQWNGRDVRWQDGIAPFFFLLLLNVLLKHQRLS